jgi:hypothetical protein
MPNLPIDPAWGFTQEEPSAAMSLRVASICDKGDVESTLDSLGRGTRCRCEAVRREQRGEGG